MYLSNCLKFDIKDTIFYYKKSNQTQFDIFNDKDFVCYCISFTIILNKKQYFPRCLPRAGVSV